VCEYQFSDIDGGGEDRGGDHRLTHPSLVSHLRGPEKRNSGYACFKD
jgi:hypothetical protein